MRIEQIEIHAKSIGAGHLVAVLEPRRTMSPLLIISGYERQGYMLEIKDPTGYPVWSVMLNGEGAVGGPDFGSDAGAPD